MTAKEIYESVTDGGSTDFAEAAAIFDHTGRWCLIDGLAVNCYVEPVYTIDADIVVATENLARVRKSLATAGFQLEEFAHSLNASKPGSKLQIQFTQDARYQDFIDRAERRDVLGTQFRSRLWKILCKGSFGRGKIPNGVQRNERKMNLTLCALPKRFRNYALDYPRKSSTKLKSETR